jgi:hypothetical protein
VVLDVDDKRDFHGCLSSFGSRAPGRPHSEQITLPQSQQASAVYRLEQPTLHAAKTAELRRPLSLYDWKGKKPPSP